MSSAGNSILLVRKQKQKGSIITSTTDKETKTRAGTGTWEPGGGLSSLYSSSSGHSPHLVYNTVFENSFSIICYLKTTLYDFRT